MQRQIWINILLVGLTLVALAAGCATPTPALTDAGRAEIYAAVVRQVATEDDTFGGELNPATVYLVRRTDESAGEPSTGSPDGNTLPASLQTGISERLASLDAEVVWIDSQDDAPMDDRGTVNDGAVIIVGAIQQQDDGTVHVAGTIYIAMLAAGGQTYVLEQIDGAWTITGTTGVAWIS